MRSAEREDARVLEEAAHDRPNANPVGQARNPRTETALASNDEIDVDAGL